MSRTKTILVTGGLGFIGSHFIDRVLRMGYRVINIDCETYAANKNLSFVGDYQHIKEDISKIKYLPYCDIIVNFAAESHVDNSISDSFNFMSTNVIGVYNMLEIIKNQKLQSAMRAWDYQMPLFVQISTDEVFGDIEKGEFSEHDRHCPSNPYSATKSAAEQLVISWSRTYQIPYIITRTTNNYGPRQHSEKLIPKVITSILDGNKVPVHGAGTHIRNWIHVSDNVEAIIAAIESGKVNECFHISSSEEHSVNDIVKMICEKMNVDYETAVENVMDRSGADIRYALNCDKMKSIGWTQKRTISNELDIIIRELRKEKKNYDSSI